MDNLSKLIIVQTVCVIAIILSIVFTKYIFFGTYKEFAAWYEKNVTVTTDVNEVLKDEI